MILYLTKRKSGSWKQLVEKSKWSIVFDFCKPSWWNNFDEGNWVHASDCHSGSGLIGTPNLLVSAQGIPQINIVASDYVSHLENGYILEQLADFEEAAYYYLGQLKHWNQALIYLQLIRSEKIQGIFVAKWENDLGEIKCLKSDYFANWTWQLDTNQLELPQI